VRAAENTRLEHRGCTVQKVGPQLRPDRLASNEMTDDDGPAATAPSQTSWRVDASAADIPEAKRNIRANPATKRESGGSLLSCRHPAWPPAGDWGRVNHQEPHLVLQGFSTGAVVSSASGGCTRANAA